MVDGIRWDTVSYLPFVEIITFLSLSFNSYIYINFKVRRQYIGDKGGTLKPGFNYKPVTPVITLLY